VCPDTNFAGSIKLETAISLCSTGRLPGGGRLLCLPVEFAMYLGTSERFLFYVRYADVSQVSVVVSEVDMHAFREP